MEEHPIQGLMQTAMENLKEMVDVNTIIGEPVETPDGQLIIPVSKVGFGFAAGGSEFQNSQRRDGRDEQRRGSHGGGDQDQNDQGQSQDGNYPFGGGSGGGVSITPVAFIVVGDKGIRVLNMEKTTHLYDRIIEQASKMIDKMGNSSGKKKSSHEVETD